MGYSPWGCKESDTTEATEHTQASPCKTYTIALYVFFYSIYFNNAVACISFCFSLFIHIFLGENYLCSGSLIKTLSIVDMQHT